MKLGSTTDGTPNAGVLAGVELPLNQILLGDCLDVLRTLPDDSLDAVVTDPPYGLGNKDPSPEDIFMYVLGCTLNTGGDFMGRNWEIPSVSVWREVFRVLKPGGYVVSFAGTRTFDLVSIGLRMAGFECRDTIAREFPTVELPILQWIQSQGMPKSHNISKAIDKKLGLEREVEGSGGLAPGRPVTAPASSEAAAWEGWGTALKPSWEPILLFRKPFKGTLADNVLEHGTGGLNIDATRVRHASAADFEAHKKGVDAIREKGGSRDKSWKNASDLSGANEVQSAGRWPANCLLEHSENCVKVGTREIAPHPQGPDRFQKTSGGGFSDAYGNQLADADPEVMPEWRCVDGCPVAALNDQSGDRPSTLTGRADPSASHDHPGTEMNPNSTFLGERTHLSRVYADGGGAARFFTQFEQDYLEQKTSGRWPSNALFVHADACRKVGTKRIRGNGLMSGSGRDKGNYSSGVYGGGWKGQTPGRQIGYVDEDGLEEIEDWDCVDGCPVKALEQQGVEAGVHAAGNKSATTNHVSGKGYGGAFKPMTNNPDYHADGTSASRFFSQFDGVPFKYVAKANRKEAGCGEFEVEHITLKPLSLIRWLVKLVTPPGVWACLGCEASQEAVHRVPTAVQAEPSESGRLLNQLSQQDSRQGPSVHSAKGMSGVPEAVHAKARPSEVLLESMQGSLSDEGPSDDRVSAVQATLQSAGEETEVLLKAVRRQAKKKTTARTKMPGVSRALRSEGSPREGVAVLLPSVRVEIRGAAAEGPNQQDSHGIQDALSAGASDGNEGRDVVGASIGDGHTSGAKPGTERSGPSHQRDQNGQSNRESGGSGKGGTRSVAEAATEAVGVPALLGEDSGCRKCPRCGKGMTKRAGVVLDMYAGSGTTCHAAVLEGMHFIGIERDEKNHAEAMKRLEIVLRRDQERKDEEETFAFAMGRTS